MTSGDMRPTAMIAGSGGGDQRRSCFCCGEVGHFARDCLQRVNRKSPGAALTCFACGGLGHFARDCPNKFTPNRTRNHPSRPNRTVGINRAGGTSAVRGEGGPNRMSAVGGEGSPNGTAGITRAAGTSAIGGEGGPNRTAGITRAGYMSTGGGEGGPNRTAGITGAGYMGTGGGEGGPNRTAGITRAGYRSAGGGEGAPNHTAGIIRTGGMSGGGGGGGPNCTAEITQAGYKSAGRGEGGPNRITGITRTGGMSADGGEVGPNSIAGITQAGGTSAGGGEGGPNHTGGITRASGASFGRGEGGPNNIAGITRTGGMSAGGGEVGPNRTVGITRASGMVAGRGEGGPNRTAGITQARGMSAGGLWIHRRELPTDQSKDSSSINGGGIGGIPSLNHRSYFPPTLSQEYGGSGSSPVEPVNQTYHNANVIWKYDTSKFFGSNGIAGGNSNREYSNLLNISKGNCGEGSRGSPKDSGEGSSARGLFLNDISSSSSGNDFDDDDYKDFNMWLSESLLSEGMIMEKRCGFVAKVSEGIDGERSSNGKYTSGKSFNNNGTTSRGPAVIEISSSSSEDEEEGIVPKNITGFLFPTGKVKEEIKRVDDDDDDEEEEEDDDDSDDYDDDDCVILESNPFEPPIADFEQKVSLSEHKSSIVHDEDITIISERGQVACRDYPHSRHHCAKFPFSKTAHESCCPQCYCYICEVVAPCEYWNGSGGHCHASDQDPIWGVMKKIRRDL